MAYTDNQLIARFTLRGLAGTDNSQMLESELDALSDQVVLEFESFKLTCDNTSKETQMDSIEKYFFHTGFLR